MNPYYFHSDFISRLREADREHNRAWGEPLAKPKKPKSKKKKIAKKKVLADGTHLH